VADAADTLRALARLYALLVMLLGLGVFAVVIMLAMSFGPQGLFGAKFLSFVIAPALAAIGLAGFIWRQKPWAMLAALSLAVFWRFAFGNETLMLNIILSAMAVAFAVITGLHLWLGRPAGGRRAG
jgi:hypothetical protein